MTMEAAVMPWMRRYVPGEVLNPAKEKKCESPRCGAVIIRDQHTAERWNRITHCCGSCFNGEPPLLKKEP